MLLDHLSSHPMLYGFPAETKSLPYFILNESKYGDLAKDANYRKLWNDLREAVAGPAGAAKSGESPTSDPSGQPRSAAAIFDGIMRSYARQEGKSIWCEKTPMHVHHLSLLARAYPNAKFVHIIRDGRDCAASFHRRWRFHPLRSVYRWKLAVRDGRAQGQPLGNRYLELRYEDVTDDAESALRSTLAFLGVPFDAAVLSAGRSRPDVASAQSRTIELNRRKANQYFPAAQLDRMERIAGRCLAELGYATSQPAGDEMPPRWRLRVWETADDFRRLGVVLRRRAGSLRASDWRYVTKRIRSALKQKSTLKS